MPLPITLTFAAAAVLINVWLAVRVSVLRIRGKHLMGDDGNPALLARMRAHANFTEYTPFALVLVGLIELAGGSATWLWVASALFVLARLAHAIGMDRPAPNPFRAGGIAVTMLVLLALAGWAVAIAWQPAGQGRAGEAIELAPPAA